MAKLLLNQQKVAACRKSAKKIADDLQKIISLNTTVSVERAVLRLFGVNGVSRVKVPYPNLVVDAVRQEGLLRYGVSNIIAYMMLQYNKDLKSVTRAIAQKKIKPSFDEDFSGGKLRPVMKKLYTAGIVRIEESRREREKLQKKFPTGPMPWLYVIVATGNIYEDIKQARCACLNGADCIAVIRSTAQSLMDYVPYGATTEGFGGTYATQENFRLMRKGLDDLMPKTGRYVNLVNYCSGLCMSEIAVMGAMERLDMMLNDAMYGIIFRDINIRRTFVDQNFSRMINAQAQIIINTGEDNYLTTADAMDKAHTVVVSDFINEQMARNAGLDEGLMGLGHAFEINPELENSFLYELATAQLVRQLFPKSPIKYMPPTKHVHGNIFRTHAIDTMFNLNSVVTGQSIHLLGMLSEGIHTPLIGDRYLSLECAKYVRKAARDLGGEIEFKKNGFIQKRAGEVLATALEMLKIIEKTGLVKAIERGYFADIKRPANGGKGADGVVERSKEYTNPFEQHWMS